MTAIRKSGGANVALTTLKRRSGGAWATVQNGYRRSGGTWVKVYSAVAPVTATVSPTTASYTGSTANAGTYTLGTGNVTASGHGGDGTYTYHWTIVSGSFTITSPNSATTAFSATLTVNSTVGSAASNGTARCTISDGTSSAFVDVPVSIRMNWTGSIN